MDKLRGIEYFVRVVEAGNFARAARELEVSPPAVTKMINALERTLGVRLLNRDSKKLSLTADGEQYLPVCANMLGELRAIEAGLESGLSRASGKLVVGVSHFINQFVARSIPVFLETYPAMSIEMRTVNNLGDPAAASVEVILFFGWLEQSSFVAKQVGQTRMVTCASPSYLEAHGTPTDPDELRSHVCLALRTPWAGGTIHDLWKYQRQGETRDVAVTPRFVTDDRAALGEAAVRGVGIMRGASFNMQPHIDQGRLVAILNEWSNEVSAPIYALYRRGARSSAKVRAFVDFAAKLFGELAPGGTGPSSMPQWYRQKWAGSRARRGAR
jgi:LysR family transcriptional regulator for bpeEF and oprC